MVVRLVVVPVASFHPVRAGADERLENEPVYELLLTLPVLEQVDALVALRSCSEGELLSAYSLGTSVCPRH